MEKEIILHYVAKKRYWKENIRDAEACGDGNSLNKKMNSSVVSLLIPWRITEAEEKV